MEASGYKRTLDGYGRCGSRIQKLRLCLPGCRWAVEPVSADKTRIRASPALWWPSAIVCFCFTETPTGCSLETWALNFDNTPTFLSMRPIRCAKEQSERICTAGDMSHCYSMEAQRRRCCSAHFLPACVRCRSGPFVWSVRDSIPARFCITQSKPPCLHRLLIANLSR